MTAPWEDKDDGKLKDIIKKAKRKTIIRNTVISLVVSLIVLVGGIIGNAQITNKIAMDGLREQWLMQSISRPNLYESGYDDERGFLSGKLEYHLYKVVEGVPIVWKTEKMNYSWSTRFSMLSGNHSYINVPDPEMTDQAYEYYRSYNSENGQREMLFYVPQVNYNGKVLNDLSALDQMNPDKLVELAISFDKSYTQSEVEQMLPDGLSQVWYWVDTYDHKKKLEFVTSETSSERYAIPESAGQVYGYGRNWEGIGEPVPKDFLSSLEFGISRNGKYVKEFQRIWDYLRQDKAAPEEDDVQLLGVVVTGTAKELQSLQGQPYVHAAVLGAVVDKY